MPYIHNVNISGTTYLLETTLMVAPTLTGTAYTGALTDFTLVPGAHVHVKFAATNPANATLNINGTGAKYIYYDNVRAAAGLLKVNHTYTLVYDGTQWQLVGDIDTNTQNAYGNIKTDGTLTAANQAVVTDASKKITSKDMTVTEHDVTAESGGATTFLHHITQDSQGQIAAVTRPIQLASTSAAGIIKIGTSATDAAAGNHNHDNTYIKKITSTDNAIARFDGTGGQIQNSNIIISDTGLISGFKSTKLTTRIYPLVTSGERSQWYKITFPYYNATTATSAKWFMNSFDLHFGGGYSSNPSGVAHIAFYWTRAANNGAWTLAQGEALIKGIRANKITLYYRIAEPGILYVNNTGNAYNGIWIDNLYVDDTSPSLDWSTTTITSIAAITDSTNPALSAYTKLTASYLYNEGGTIKTDNNFEGKYIKGTWLYTSAATAKTTATKLAIIESDNFIYYITPANALKSGVGTTAIGATKTPIYWDGSAFKAGSAIKALAYKDTLAWNEITQSGANAIDSGSSDVTASTELLTSYASNSGFSDTNAVGKVYRRAASKVVNATLVKAALGTVTTTTKKYLKDTGVWAQVAWSDISGVPSAFAAAAHDHNRLNGLGRLNANAEAIAFNTTVSVGNRLSWCIYDSTSRTKDADNSPSFDASTLNMPWDWGAYITQVAFQNAGTRIQIRGAGNKDNGEGANPRYSPNYGTWREVVTAPKATQMGSAIKPIYISNTGQVTEGTALSDGAYKSILNNTSAGALGWNTAGAANANNLRLINVNTLAYWNGCYNGTNSNLAYYKGGAFGTMAKETATDYAKLASPAFTGIPTAPTAANGTSTTQIATTAFVNNTLAYINAMTFKGTLGTGGTVTALPNSHEAGDTYRIITAGTWAGKYCEVGTLIICIKDGAAAADADWTSVETNEDGAVIGPSSSTDNAIVRFDGATGRLIQNSKVTIDDNGNIVIAHAASNTMTADSANPKITFSENGSQPVHLIYTDYDSYRSPAGLKIIGGASATPAWLEVEGNTWSAGFKITGKTTSLTDNNLTFSQGGGWSMSDATWIRTVGSKSVYMNAGTFRNDGTTQLRTLQHINGNITADGSWTTGATGTANSGDGNATRGTLGTSILAIGNATARPAAGTAGGANNAKGYLRIYGEATGYGELTYNDSMFASNKSIYLTTSANSGISNEVRGITAANDYWRVAGGATESNAGYMEIATADDANEPIYVRQYSGVFSTLKRTATLLDASGNTSFPGKVTANDGFSGALTGNADTATAIKTAGTTAQFYRGDNTWSDTISGGTFKITNNSNTVTIGSQNSSFTHIYNSASIPFIFNNSVLTTTGTLGNATYPFNHLYLGAKGNRSIYYVGTKSTNAMITFLDNTNDTYGNGIKIGGGGVVVVGSGESATNLSVSASSETLFLLSDGVVNIEAGGDTIANRIGMQVSSAGHLVPIKAEAGNSNAQDIGTSSILWRSIYASGSIYLTKAGETGIEVKNTQTTNPNNVAFIVGSSGNGGIYSRKHSKWIVYSDASGNVVLNGNANTTTEAKWLMNRGATSGTNKVTISDSSWNPAPIPSGHTAREVVWKQRWTEAGLTYTPSGGNATTNSDTADLRLWLSSADASNVLQVNMDIDGQIYALGGFRGNLNGNAATATTATNLAAAPSLSADGNNIKVTAGGKTSGAFTVPYATSATTLTHRSLNNTTINNTAGSFAFSGSGEPWNGTDWVGLQIGDNVDKFQISANNNTLVFRQNDSGGTNSTNWQNWVTMLTSANYTSYTVTKTGSGASGTWGINISGNAATLFTANATNTSETGQDNRIKTAIKTYFDANKASIARNKTLSLYISTGNGIQAMGYFLSGYDTSPYGGFFISHYDTPRYVGISNGVYTCYELVRNDGRSYGINITGSSASCTGNAATATALTSNAGDAYQPVYFSGGKPVVAAPVQYSTWQINQNHKKCTLTKAGCFTADTYVIALVVTGGEAGLNGPLTWTSAANTLTITTSVATGAAVSGYVITARGVASGATAASSAS